MKGVIIIYGCDHYDHSRLEGINTIVENSMGDTWTPSTYQDHINFYSKRVSDGKVAHAFVMEFDTVDPSASRQWFKVNPIRKRIELNVEAKAKPKGAKKVLVNPFASAGGISMTHVELMAQVAQLNAQQATAAGNMASDPAPPTWHAVEETNF